MFGTAAMDRQDWETLLLTITNIGLKVESVDADNGRITLRVPDLCEKANYHL